MFYAGFRCLETPMIHSGYFFLFKKLNHYDLYADDSNLTVKVKTVEEIEHKIHNLWYPTIKNFLIFIT